MTTLCCFIACVYSLVCLCTGSFLVCFLFLFLVRPGSSVWHVRGFLVRFGPGLPGLFLPFPSLSGPVQPRVARSPPACPVQPRFARPLRPGSVPVFSGPSLKKLRPGPFWSPAAFSRSPAAFYRSPAPHFRSPAAISALPGAGQRMPPLMEMTSPVM